MPRQTPIPKGTLFTVTCGEYSDYSIMGVFRSFAELDMDALIEAFRQEIGPPDYGEEYKFLAFLARRGLVETVDCMELNLNSNTTALYVNIMSDNEDPLTSDC